MDPSDRATRGHAPARRHARGGLARARPARSGARAAVACDDRVAPRADAVGARVFLVPLGTPGSPALEPVDAAVEGVLDWYRLRVRRHTRASGCSGSPQGGSMGAAAAARPTRGLRLRGVALRLRGARGDGRTGRGRRSRPSAGLPRARRPRPVIPAEATARTRAWAAANTDVTDRSYAACRTRCPPRSSPTWPRSSTPPDDRSPRCASDGAAGDLRTACRAEVTGDR